MGRTFLLISLMLGIVFFGGYPVWAQDKQEELRQYLSEFNKYTGDRKIYVQTDKYMYESEETIWISAMVFDRNTHLPVSDDPRIRVELKNPLIGESVTLLLTTNNGIGEGSIWIPKDIQAGNYILTASIDGSNRELFRKELMIKRYAMPFYLVNIRMEEKYYDAGDEMVFRFSVTDHFSSPIKKAAYKLQIINGDKIIIEKKDKLDKEGTGSMAMTLPDKLEGGRLFARISFKRKRLKEEALIEIPVKTEDLQVNFFPAGGSLVAGLNNTIYFDVNDHRNMPFPFGGAILDQDGKVITELSSDEQGRGKITLIPDPDQAYHLRIDKPYKVNTDFDLPKVRSEGCIISGKETTTDSVYLQVRCNPGVLSSYFLGAVNRGELDYFDDFDIGQKLSIAVPVSDLKPGVIHFTLFDREMLPVTETLKYITPGEYNNLTTRSRSERVDLRDNVEVEINTDPDSYISLSAVDKFRLKKSASQNILSYLLIDSELENNVVIDGMSLAENGNPANIENILGYSVPVNDWAVIFKLNGDDRVITPDTDNKVRTGTSLALYHQFRDGQTIEYSNYEHNNIYLASNPKLFEKIKKDYRKAASEPYYKQLLNVGTPVREVVYAIRNYRVVGDNIIFPDGNISLNELGGALIVIDGIRVGGGISTLDNLNPYEVEEIRVSTSSSDVLRYSSQHPALIEIDLKKGKKKKDENPTEFTTPDYGNRVEDSDQGDFRTTINWIPFTKREALPHPVSFYHSDIRGDVIGIVEGLDSSGRPLYDEFHYTTFQVK